MYKKPEKNDLLIIFPMKYVKCDIEKEFRVNRKFYITYILINYFRTKFDISRITISDILGFYGVALNPNKKPEAFKETIDVLKYMEQEEMIKIDIDLEKINYKTLIDIDINPEIFDSDDKFVTFTYYEFDRIMGISKESLTKRKISKESVLIVFLYMKSFMKRKKKESTEPSAFWGSIEQMSFDIGLSQRTITKCISVLISDENQWHCPIFVKHRTNMSNQEIIGKKIPNIYVEKKEGHQKEIQLAIDKILAGSRK